MRQSQAACERGPAMATVFCMCRWSCMCVDGWMPGWTPATATCDAAWGQVHIWLESCLSTAADLHLSICWICTSASSASASVAPSPSPSSMNLLRQNLRLRPGISTPIIRCMAHTYQCVRYQRAFASLVLHHNATHVCAKYRLS